MENNQLSVDAKYLPELMAEKDSIDPSFVHALRLLSKEIEDIKNPKKNESFKDKKQLHNMFDERLPKIECNIRIPVEEYPQINFVGKIIGPGGSTLQGIQDLTSTKIAVLGKGSLRDKKKAEEHLASKEPKWEHLNSPLHVRITALAPLEQAYVSIGRACAEIGKILQVDTEEYGERFQGMQPQRGRGRGAASNGRGMARGGRGGLPQQQQQQHAAANRVGNTLPRGGARGVNRGGSASSRGVSRGGRGAGMGAVGRGSTRGSMRGASQSRFQKPQPTADPYASQGYASSLDTYEDYLDPQACEVYGGEGYADPYGEGGYAEESYDYFYGDSYENYGAGAEQNVQSNQFGGNKSFRGKMMPARGSGGRGRGAKPY